MKVKPLFITAYAIARNVRYTVRVSVTMGAIPTRSYDHQVRE
jgi:hypothetical protein